jgi:hypothetical protein
MLFMRFCVEMGDNDLCYGKWMEILWWFLIGGWE